MGDNVTYFGDLADKFDALVAYDEKLLDSYVEGEGYSTSSMVLASSAMALMTFAKAFVDVGRLGNGILIEGGFKGVGKDVLRAVNFAGGAGAIIGRGTKLLRLVQAGDTCVPFAYTNSLRFAGQRFLITVEELASKAGINLPAIMKSGITPLGESQIIQSLLRLGIPVRILTQITSRTRMGFQQLLQLLKSNPGGVVTFGVNGPKMTMGHQLYATFTRLGGVVIRDPGSKLTIYRSVADLERAFGAGAFVMEGPIAFIPNALLTTAASVAETAGGLAAYLPLAFQVIPVVTTPAADPETAVQSLMIHEKLDGGANGQRIVPSITGNYNGVPGKYHTVIRGDWLSKIAKHYYGNLSKWPVIYAANRKTIGNNPDLIVPNQKLFIPDLPLARIIAASALSSGAAVPV